VFYNVAVLIKEAAEQNIILVVRGHIETDLHDANFLKEVVDRHVGLGNERVDVFDELFDFGGVQF